MFDAEAAQTWDRKPLLDETDTHPRRPPEPWKSQRSAVSLLSLALFLSLGLNGFYIIKPMILHKWTREPPTPYAGLSRNIPVAITRNSTFTSLDRKVADAAWNAPEFRVENGVVALKDSFTQAAGLPHAMRWPWDEEKGVYVLSSSHEMHCLQITRQAVNDANDGLPAQVPHEHVLHCLDYLRQVVMCNANDLPLYSGRLHSQAHERRPMEGVGQVMRCRDWHKLQTWASERSACYDSHGPLHMSETEKYQHCPDDRRPWERDGT